MLFSKVKDLKKRKSFFNQEKSRKVYKFVFINLLAKKKNSIKVFQLKNSKRFDGARMADVINFTASIKFKLEELKKVLDKNRF